MNTEIEANDSAATMSPGRMTAVWSVMTMLAASAAVFIRYCAIPATSIGFWRVAVAAAVFLPFWFVQWRREGKPWPISLGAGLAGFFLGIHFATWCWSIQNTTVANASLFIGLQPLISPFIARWLVGERLNRGELVAVGLALAGTAWILSWQYSAGPDHARHIKGMMVAFVSAGLCATYFVLSRKHRPRQHVLLFSTAVYATAAATQAACAVLFSGGIRLGGPVTWCALGALVLLPTIGGHTLAMYLLRHAKAQVVTLSVPAQFVVSAVAAAVLFKEVPEWWFYPGALVIGAGVVLGVAKGT